MVNKGVKVIRVPKKIYEKAKYVGTCLSCHKDNLVLLGIEIVTVSYKKKNSASNQQRVIMWHKTLSVASVTMS
jgi:hypothetical protein